MHNNSPIHENIEGMLRLTLEFPEVRILGSYAEWRVVGERPTGEVRGLWESAILLATDGVAAWFMVGRGAVVYGHLANFIADKKEPYFGPRKAKGKSKATRLREELAMRD